MFRGQKGITLVALVITIIVLLILAGVTIAALSGDNGILTNASKSQQENAIGTAKDLVSMAINEATNAWYDYTYLNGNNTTSSGTVGATQKETAENFIKSATYSSDVSVTTKTVSSKLYVEIKTTDKNPKTIHAEITAKGGLGSWEDGAAS